ncbi:hydrolase [Roseovarius sp. HI0049]|nr:hydrolase [Roseovarius sp. HI0049]
MKDHDQSPPQEQSWTLDGLTYAGLAWGPEDGRPVLATHGWMDHADSFRELGPRLTGCRVVALDLSGQGHSAHRSPDATYNIWDDLPQMAALLDTLGWKKCTLLGHSRGANINSLFAAAQPNRVNAVIALDSLVPDPVAETAVVDTLRAFIEDTRHQATRRRRSFASKEEYITRRSERRNSRQTAEALADRALVETPEGVRTRADARLFASSALKLTRPQIEAVLAALTMPVLNIWAKDGIPAYTDWPADARHLAEERAPDYEAIDLPGDHHFHLEPAGADRIATAILDFLDRKT